MIDSLTEEAHGEFSSSFPSLDIESTAHKIDRNEGFNAEFF